MVNNNGNVAINHKFKDVFDLRPFDSGSRSFEHDVVSIITGFLANGDKKVEDTIKALKNKTINDSLRWSRGTH